MIKPQLTTPPLDTSQWPLLLKVGSRHDLAQGEGLGASSRYAQLGWAMALQNTDIMQ